MPRLSSAPPARESCLQGDSKILSPDPSLAHEQTGLLPPVPRGLSRAPCQVVHSMSPLTQTLGREPRTFTYCGCTGQVSRPQGHSGEATPWHPSPYIHRSWAPVLRLGTKPRKTIMQCVYALRRSGWRVVQQLTGPIYTRSRGESGAHTPCAKPPAGAATKTRAPREMLPWP